VRKQYPLFQTPRIKETLQRELSRNESMYSSKQFRQEIWVTAQSNTISQTINGFGVEMPQEIHASHSPCVIFHLPPVSVKEYFPRKTILSEKLQQSEAQNLEIICATCYAANYGNDPYSQNEKD